MDDDDVADTVVVLSAPAVRLGREDDAGFFALSLLTLLVPVKFAPVVQRRDLVPTEFAALEGLTFVLLLPICWRCLSRRRSDGLMRTGCFFEPVFFGGGAPPEMRALRRCAVALLVRTWAAGALTTVCFVGGGDAGATVVDCTITVGDACSVWLSFVGGAGGFTSAALRCRGRRRTTTNSPMPPSSPSSGSGLAARPARVRWTTAAGAVRRSVSSASTVDTTDTRRTAGAA